MWRLIEASEGLTKTILITINEVMGEFTRDEVQEIAWTAGALNCANSTTHLSELLELMGTNFRFNLHYGAYDNEGKFNTSGQFAHQDGCHDAPMHYTFWLMPSILGLQPLPREVEVQITRAELEAIDLTQDGL